MQELSGHITQRISGLNRNSEGSPDTAEGEDDMQRALLRDHELGRDNEAGSSLN